MEPRELARVMRALSEEVRLWILWLLSKRPMCVCELMYVLDISQPKASRHLAYLRNAGLVDCRRENRWVVYYLKDDVDDAVRDILKILLERLSAYDTSEKLGRRLKELGGDFREKHAVEV